MPPGLPGITTIQVFSSADLALEILVATPLIKAISCFTDKLELLFIGFSVTEKPCYVLAKNCFFFWDISMYRSVCLKNTLTHACAVLYHFSANKLCINILRHSNIDNSYLQIYQFVSFLFNASCCNKCCGTFIFNPLQKYWRKLVFLSKYLPFFTIMIIYEGRSWL